MKFLRVGSLGQEKVAALDNNSNIRDLSNYIKDLDPSTINFESLKKLQKINLEDLPKIQSNTRIGACINKPNNMIKTFSY